jgi:TrfA protein
MMAMERIGLTAQQLLELEERKKITLEIARQREEAQVVQLPLWRDDRRGTPNDFLRSALFAAIQGKDRKHLTKVVLYSQKNLIIKFTGLQLNQEDLDVYQAILHCSRQMPLGVEAHFTGYGLLKTLRLSTGGAMHERLENSIHRLANCSLTIETDKYIYGGNRLIEKYSKRKEDGQYLIQLDRNLIQLFAPDGWSAINWEQRSQIQSKPLSQYLHGYFSSHEKPYPVNLSTLQDLSGSKNKQKASFKRQTKTALDELVKINFLESWTLDGDMVAVKRVPNSRLEAQKNEAEKERYKLDYYK